MDEIIHELYYMIEDWAGQQDRDNEEVKNLEGRKRALQEEIAGRVGDGGWELLEALTELELKLEDIHDKALFRGAARLGIELARPEAGVKG